MQPRWSVLVALLFCLLAAGSCKREPAIASVRVDSGAQARMEPITVTGCLSAGVLADTTWVLLGRDSDAAAPGSGSTYEIVGINPRVLRDHERTRVRVSGTLEAEQTITSTTGMVPDTERPIGTSGRAEVGTTSSFNLRRLRVARIEPAGGRCR